ncbi:hypothetical protein PspLS_11391 [Pyricularia sp. CBS 133598]|nr:hypothetical protein PspLS_11391 [Pyricularia sp. CBS 133598]
MASDTNGNSISEIRHGLWQKPGALVPPLAAVLKIAISPSSVSEAAGMPASAVLGALLHLVKSCQNASEAYDWIKEVFAELQRFSDRLEVLLQRPMDALLKKQVVAILGW